MDTFVLGITLFTMIVLTLVSIIIFARSKLVSSGDVNIIINGEKKVSVPAGGKLLQTLAAEKLFVPSACGGGGTCVSRRMPAMTSRLGLMLVPCPSGGGR